MAAWVMDWGTYICDMNAWNIGTQSFMCEHTPDHIAWTYQINVLCLVNKNTKVTNSLNPEFTDREGIFPWCFSE